MKACEKVETVKMRQLRNYFDKSLDSTWEDIIHRIKGERHKSIWFGKKKIFFLIWKGEKFGLRRWEEIQVEVFWQIEV